MKTAVTEIGFNDHIAQWKRAVAGWSHTEWPEVIETSVEREYIHACGLLHAAMNAAKSGGYTATSGGKQNESGGKSMWITANGKRLTVAYVPKPRKQAVQKTSKEAYHTINFDTIRGKIARLIMERTQRGLDITRNEIEAATGLKMTNVCGRVKELLKDTEEKPLRMDGKDWRLVVSDERMSNVSHEKNQALRFVEWQKSQTSLF